MSQDLNAIDFSQFGSWEKIEAPTGAVYYIVPGTGYVYDPFMSSQKGRPVLWQNPKPEYEKRKEAEKKANKAASPEGQLLPLAGIVAGTVGAKHVVDWLGPTTAQDKFLGALAEEKLKDLAVKESIEQTTTQALAPEATTTAGAFTTGLSGAPVGVQSLADGSVLMSDGTIQAATQSVGTTGAEAAIGVTPYLGAAGAALGGYGVYNAIENNDPLSGGISGAGMGLGLGMAAPLVGMALPGWGTLGLMALGGAAGGFGLTELLGHKSTKQYEAERWGELQDKGVTGASAAYAANHPGDDSGVWSTGQFAGKKWNWEDAKTLAKEDPTHFNLVLGNYETFGNDWDTYSQDQRNQIISRMLNEDLYNSSKGDIRVSNADRARQIKDEVLSGQVQVVPTTPPEAKGMESPQSAALKQGTGESSMKQQSMMGQPLPSVVVQPQNRQPASPVMGALPPQLQVMQQLGGIPQQAYQPPVVPTTYQPSGPVIPIQKPIAGQPVAAVPVPKPLVVPQMGNMGAVPINVNALGQQLAQRRNSMWGGR